MPASAAASDCLSERVVVAFCVFISIEMGIMVRERAAQESALMELQRRGDYLCGALQPEPQLPCGWEKCLDLKVVHMYTFVD